MVIFLLKLKRIYCIGRFDKIIFACYKLDLPNALAKPEMIYLKNVRAKIAMDFT